MDFEYSVKTPKHQCQGHMMREDIEIDEGGLSITIGTEQPQYPSKLCGLHVQSKLLQDDPCLHEYTMKVFNIP